MKNFLVMKNFVVWNTFVDKKNVALLLLFLKTLLLWKNIDIRKNPVPRKALFSWKLFRLASLFAKLRRKTFVNYWRRTNIDLLIGCQLYKRSFRPNKQRRGGTSCCPHSTLPAFPLVLRAVWSNCGHGPVTGERDVTRVSAAAAVQLKRAEFLVVYSKHNNNSRRGERREARFILVATHSVGCIWWWVLVLGFSSWCLAGVLPFWHWHWRWWCVMEFLSEPEASFSSTVLVWQTIPMYINSVASKYYWCDYFRRWDTSVQFKRRWDLYI